MLLGTTVASVLIVRDDVMPFMMKGAIVGIVLFWLIGSTSTNPSAIFYYLVVGAFLGVAFGAIGAVISYVSQLD